jgi:N-acetylglucosamine-6-phosphate deacetylase
MAEENSPIMGLHLEGPYLTPKRASHEFGDKLCEPNPDEYKPLLDSTTCIKRWDASPEVPGTLEFARYLKSKGVLAALTHTEVEYKEVKEAYEAGFTHAAHFYNGMPGFHKCREYKYEGTVESVYLVDDMTIELIADGRHLPNTILNLAYKVKGVEKTCLVTAALAYAGVETTETNHPNIIIEDGVCKSADHANLVGSIATMDVLVKNMVKAGVQLEHVLRMASETPARLMNVYDRKGSLEKGKDADILIIDEKQNVRAIWAMGKLVEGSNTLWK